MSSILGLSYPEAQDIYSHIVYKLPLFAFPVYLIFLAFGKGATRTAVYFSISTPGLLVFVMVLWEALVTTPTYALPQPFSTILITRFIIEPAYWIFPAVWITQVVRILKGIWREVRWSTLVFCGVLVFLYFCAGAISDLARS
jgi:hypothetical protein